MKPVPKNFSTTQSQKILTALILTSVVSVGSGLALIKSSAAAHEGLQPETGRNRSKKTLQAIAYRVKLLMLFCGMLLRCPGYPQGH
jgi:hypothetical protein